MRSVFVCLVMLAASVSGVAAVTVDIFPSISPGAGSPNYYSYRAKALSGIEQGGVENGDRSVDPSAYEIAGDTIYAGDLATSYPFNSWGGQLDPQGVFAGEFGNRLFFGLHIYGDGTEQFMASKMYYNVSSNLPNITATGNYSGYSVYQFGINWGADRQKGGGDDIIYTSGGSTTLVDEVVFLGRSIIFNVTGTDPQEAMDDYYAWFDNYDPAWITCRYSVLTAAGRQYVNSLTLNILSEPELEPTPVTVPVPGAMMLASLGLGIVRYMRGRGRI